MDYHSMKRKELQVLCKKHNIPANSTNSVMADKLSELLKEKQKPSTRQPPTCMRSSVGTIDETEPVVTRRQAKKVRFSPNNEFVEYELRSDKKEKALVTKTEGKGKSVAMKVDKPVVDSNNIVKLTDDGIQIPVKLTRSRVQIMEKDGVAPVNEKKQGKRAVNDVEKASGSVEETVVSRVRVTRSKAEVLNDGVGFDLNPRVEKKRGRQNAKDSEKVETSKEIVDIPVRVTRSREQTLNDNIGNTVANPGAEKKRTRREMKAANPAPEDNQELPKRKLRNSKEIIAEVPESQYHVDKGSRRSRRTEAKVEDSTVLDEKVSKLEVVKEGKVTRSKAQLVVKFSEGNSKSKTENEESKTAQQVEHAGRKNANRRKSVVQPELTVEGKGIDKPVVGKRERVKETEMVESPNVGTRRTQGPQSKEQAGNLSKIDEGFEDKEIVAGSGKDVSRNETKAVEIATTGSNRSRKRKGDPVIEDQAIEIDYASVDESPKRLTRSSSKTDGKKQQQSNLRTPTSKQSGAIVRDKSSQKRAKLTVTPHATKQSDSEKVNAEKSNRSETPVSKLVTSETPVSKLESSETDEKVTATKCTPAIDESARRLTRSAIQSERKAVGSLLEKGDKKKQASQSAIKGQPIGVAVDETPRRFTRSGIKHGGNTASKLSEKVDKKKQPSRSTIKGQPHQNAQVSSPEVAEVRPNPDVISGSEVAEGQSTMSDKITVQDDTIGVQFETPKELEEMELTNSESGLGNLQINKEIEVTKSGSESENLQIDEIEQIDEIVKEPVVSVGKTVVTEENVDISLAVITERNNDDAGNTCDVISSEAGFSVVRHASVEQSDLKSELKEMEARLEPSISEGVEQCIEDDAVGSEQDALTFKDTLENLFEGELKVADNADDVDEKQIISEFVSEDKGVDDSIDVLGSPDMGNRDDAQKMESDIVGQSIGDDILQDLAMEGKDICDDIITAQSSLADQGEPSTGENIIKDLAMDRCDVADDGIDGEKESEVVPSTGNVDATNEAKSVSVHSPDENTLGDSVLSSGVVEDERVDTIKEHEYDPVPSTDSDAFDTPVEDKNDDLDMTQELEPVSEPSTANNLLQIPDATDDPGHEIDGNNMPMELERDSEPSNANNTLEIPVSDDIVGIEHVNIINDLASDPKPSAGNDASDPLSLGKDDLGVTKEPESDSEASTHNIDVEDNKFDAPLMGELDVVEGNSDEQDGDSEQEQSVSRGSHTMDEPDVGGDTRIENASVVHEVLTRSPDQEPEAVLSVTVNEVPHDDDVDGSASIRRSEPSTSKGTPRIPDRSGNYDAVIRIDAQEDSIANSNNDSVSNNLGDHDGLVNAIEITDTKNDVSFGGNEQEIRETSELDEIVRSKECENLTPDMIEQRTEEAEMTTENDNALDDNNEQMVATVDHDLGRDRLMDDGSSHGIDMLDCQLAGNISAHESPTREESSQQPTVDDTVSDRIVGDIGAHETPNPEESLPITYNKEEFSDRIVEDIAVHESPTAKESLSITYNKEESPVDDAVLDPPTSVKDDDKNKQEETQNTVTSADWGSYSLGIDEYHNPVTGNVSDVLGKGMKDDRVSIEEGSCPDGKSSQDVDVMKANANVYVAEDFFNWSEDSSLRAFFTTPTSRVDLKDSQEDMARFTFPDDKSGDIGTNGTATHDFHHQWGSEPLRTFNEESQDNVAQRQGLNEEPENDIFRVPNFDEFSQQYFGGKYVDDGSGEMLGKNEEHFDFKVDQVNDLVNEEAGASHYEAPSGLKDNLIPSGKFQQKHETQPKGSEMGADLSFDKGMKKM